MPSSVATKSVLYVDQTAVLSGAELALCNLVSHLDRDRWSPSVVLWESGPLKKRLDALGAPATVLGIGSALRAYAGRERAGKRLFNAELIQATTRQIALLTCEVRRSNADLIHANSLKACVIAGLAGRIAGVPVIWQVHSIVSRPKVSPGLVKLMRSLARVVPAHVICNSRATAACFPGNSKVSVVYCGVSSASFAMRKRANEGRARVGMIARFSPEKGQHILLDAAERLSGRGQQIDWVFAGSAMFGEDEYQRHIELKARSGPVAEHAQFLGFVEDVSSLIDQLDIIVHPSVEPEGLGQTVLEAMMSGKSVVVSAAGGSAELVEDGVTGRLVPPGDATALAQAIDDLLSDPAAAAEMGRRARQVAIERYDIRKTTRAIEDVYEKVLARA